MRSGHRVKRPRATMRSSSAMTARQHLLDCISLALVRPHIHQSLPGSITMTRTISMTLAIMMSGCYRPPPVVMVVKVPCHAIADTVSTEEYRGLPCHSAAYDCGSGARATAFFSGRNDQTFAIISTSVDVFAIYLDHSATCRSLGGVPVDYHLSANATLTSRYSCTGGSRLRLESSTSNVFVEELWPDRRQ